ncbi:MAG: peptide-N4-asparagine amidase [Terriglobales bacterium]
MTISRFSKAACLALLFATSSTLAFAGVGSSNTATADPPVPHPNTRPCKVVLFKHQRFADFNAKPFSYTPPAACPAPWAKVILVGDFSVTAGIQYDRTANIWLGSANIYFGTSSEPDPSDARHWQIQRDLTDYSSIFTTAQGGTADIGNLVNKTYTGVIFGTVTMEFYPPSPKAPAPVTADQVIAFSGGPTGGTVALDTTGQCCQPSLAQTLTLPTNIQRAYLDVFAQSQNYDEFWYTCVPNDVSGELESCPNTAFRESEITIDGTPAGVAPVYPWIYTGGIDPYLWFPIPGVQTLNFVPYRVDLTPFAAMLDDGNQHTISMSVYNADDYFSATASLLLYLDHGSTQLTGAVTQNTLTAPSPTITEKVHASRNGNVGGTVKTASAHDFTISGYVNTSAGTVTTTLAQNIDFSNLQKFTINGDTYEQDITQGTNIDSTTTVVDSAGTHVNDVSTGWPMSMDIVLLFNPDGSGTQTTTVNQNYSVQAKGTLNGNVVSFSVLNNSVTPTDALEFNSSFQITGNENQSSAQNYYDYDISGYCYSKSLTAANNILTSISSGQGCTKK